MTKFSTYITEESLKSDELLSFMEENCQPFLTDWRKYPRGLMFSGRKEKTEDWSVRTVRKDRRPSDSGAELHRYFDDQLYKRLGIRGRSECIFVYHDSYSASQYGNTYIIFPMGKYEIIFNPEVADLYNYIRRDLQIDPKNFNNISPLPSDASGTTWRWEWENMLLKKYGRDFAHANLEKSDTWDEWHKERIEEWRDDAVYGINNMVKGYKKASIVEYNKEGGSVEGMVHCDKYVMISKKFEGWVNSGLKFGLKGQ